jgi:hypothetical protein
MIAIFSCKSLCDIKIMPIFARSKE